MGTYKALSLQSCDFWKEKRSKRCGETATGMDVPAGYPVIKKLKKNRKLTIN